MREKLQADIEAFLVYLLEIRGYSEQTIITYEVALRQMFELSEYYEEEGSVILDISPFRFAIVKNHKKTIVKKLSAIHSLIKYLEDQCHQKIRLIGDTSIKVPQSLPKPIEKQYIQEVLATATLQEQLLITMLYGLGLRISELSGLKLASIAKEWIEITGKGQKSRELPLMPKLEQLIALYRENAHPQTYLFEKKKSPMNAAQLRYLLGKCFRRLGIKATPHQLRHSFATHLLDNGARIADISELLGHQSMATTQVYTKLSSVKKMQEYMNAHPLAAKD